MPKPLNEQVLVITGASSGIGRATAMAAGKAGATVVLAARNDEALSEVATLIERAGGRALVVKTDVSKFDHVQQLADTAMGAYGHIDTWVNDAGVMVYATAEETTVEEVRRIMEVNFLGMVHGVSAVLPYMKQQGYGTIINIGSVESQLSLPLQAAYAASKHAVKGYTEALRMEQDYAQTGIKVVLVMPSGINTPLFNHARSRIGVKPKPTSPVYEPEMVAQSILNAAEHPQRDIYAGGAGLFFVLLQKFSPTLLDKLMIGNGIGFKTQTSHQPDDGQDNLFQTIPEHGRVQGDFGHLAKSSAYTPLFELSPRSIRRLLMLTGGAIVARNLLARKKPARG